MGLRETKKFLHSIRNNHQAEKAAQKMGESLCQLYICQEISNQNIQRAQKSTLPGISMTDEEMGK
jgi:hypothetical protein